MKSITITVENGLVANVDGTFWIYCIPIGSSNRARFRPGPVPSYFFARLLAEPGLWSNPRAVCLSFTPLGDLYSMRFANPVVLLLP